MSAALKLYAPTLSGLTIQTGGAASPTGTAPAAVIAPAAQPQQQAAASAAAAAAPAAGVACAGAGASDASRAQQPVAVSSDVDRAEGGSSQPGGCQSDAGCSESDTGTGCPALQPDAQALGSQPAQPGSTAVAGGTAGGASSSSSSSSSAASAQHPGTAANPHPAPCSPTQAPAPAPTAPTEPPTSHPTINGPQPTSSSTAPPPDPPTSTNTNHTQSPPHASAPTPPPRAPVLLPLHAPPALLPVPYTEFYNDAVNADDFNLKEDVRRWKSVSGVIVFVVVT